MRNAFADELTALADRDPRVVLLSGDIGNRLFNDFRDRHPDRFYNVGVAEADMIGIAAGMALGGLRPIAYTIASFAIYRAFEQIRVDLCYPNLPVLIVGVGGGLGYAANGPTHHSCEDLAVLRSLPNMSVLCPADSWELRALMHAALERPGPTYMRIGKKGEPLVHHSLPSVEIGRAIRMREGTEVTLLCAGTLLPDALEAAEKLTENGISTSVYSMHTIKPLDERLLNQLFETNSIVATVEEHSRIGGLGGAVAEWRADHPSAAARLIRFGTPDAILHHTGEQEDARISCGLTAEAFVDAIKLALKTSERRS